MVQRRSDRFLLFIAFLVLTLGFLFAHACFQQKRSGEDFRQKRELVKKLGLTDLCLFTDARYTRHPSMADLNTPFQDYPLSFEHFPSGSILTPPPHLKRHGMD